MPTPLPGPSYPAPSGFLRDCGSDVVGTLAAYQIRQAVKAGPVAFVWVHDAAIASPRLFRHRRGGYFTGKYLVLVQTGQQATVSVPEFERTTVSLLYNPAHFAPVLPVRAGERIVTFRSCPGTTPGWGAATQFNGGIIVAGARCVVLDVRPAASGRASRVRMPFGRGTRCS